MSRFAILLAGPVRRTDGLLSALAGRRVVAADGGMAHAATLDLQPELWVGDFDSEPSGLAPRLAAVPRESHRRGKDQTDGALAIRAALERGARDLLLVGALRGPRTDHAVTNLVLALATARRGAIVRLHDGREQGVPLSPRPVRLVLVPGQVFSVLRFSAVTGLTLRGARWPLENVDVPFHSSLTQSNEALGPIEASLVAGEAILLAQEDGPSGPFA